MRTLKNRLGLCALAILALPAAAPAAVVPPENSAATQYTEAIPTGGGRQDSSKVPEKRSPAAVLGSHKAKKLESEGRTGREVAAVVAATAPSSAPAPAPEPAPAPQPAPDPEPEPSGDSRDRQAESGGGAANGKGDPPAGARQSAPPAQQLDAASGSSGLGEVLAQATGASSAGALGGLLPLLVLATLIWAIAYGLRQGRRPAQ